MMTYRQLKSVLLFCLPYLVQVAAQVQAGTQFASHVSVSTPSRSFIHGVGDPLPSISRRTQNNNFKFTRRPAPSGTSQQHGYPRVKPTIPFNFEEAPRIMSSALWHHNMDINIPLLPPSPYKVDSPDPESLWPEGLFLPPINPQRFSISHRRSDSTSDPDDPYLLDGSEAIAAVARAKNHGELYFHDIPHIDSLFANQRLRLKNHLKPHVIGSIRQTWPYNRN